MLSDKILMQHMYKNLEDSPLKCEIFTYVPVHATYPYVTLELIENISFLSRQKAIYVLRIFSEYRGPTEVLDLARTIRQHLNKPHTFCQKETLFIAHYKLLSQRCEQDGSGIHCCHFSYQTFLHHQKKEH